MALSVLSFVMLGNSASAEAAMRRVGAEAEATAARNEKAALRTQSAWAKGFAKVGKLSALLAVGIVADGVKQASEFQKLTNVYVTAAGESQKNLKIVQDGVLKVATNTGTAWRDVAAATYTAEKAGYRGADAYKVVEAAAQGAKEENANLATVTNAVTSIMASYHLKATDSVMVTNELKAAAGESKVSFEDFSGALSTVLPIASAAKISFAGVAGAFATLTQHGTSADESTQELAATIRALNAPMPATQKLMQQFGIDANDVAMKLGDGPGGRGLTGTLNYLTETILSKMGPAGTVLLNTFNQSKTASADAATELAALSPEGQKLATAFENGAIGIGAYRKAARALPGEQGALAMQFLATYTNAKGFQSTLQQGLSQNKTYTSALKGMTGGAIGLNTALQLTGESSKATAQRVKAVSEAAKGAGKDVSGWASTQKLFSVQMDMFKQQLSVMAIRIGQQVIPVLQKVVRFFSEHPGVIKAAVIAIGGLAAAWAGLKLVNLAKSLATIATRILAIGTASTTAAGETQLGALGRSAGGAAKGVEGIGTAASRSGLLVGGAAVLGIGAFAASIHQLFNDSVKGLPALNAVTDAIAKGGLKGKPGSDVIQQSLAGVSTGNNRGEDQFSYLQRILNTPQASKMGLSLKGLFDTIQTGTAGDVAQFIDQLRALGFELNGSPDTIDKVGRYLDALFSRYNTGRVGAKQLADQQEALAIKHKLAADAAQDQKNNLFLLNGAFGLTGAKLKDVTDAADHLSATVFGLNGYLAAGTHTLQGNSQAAQAHRSILETEIDAAKAHADAVYRQTGNLLLANRAFNDDKDAIYGNALTVGFNRGELDKLFGSLETVRNNSRIDIEVTANGTFNLKDIYAGGDAQALVSGHHATGGPIFGKGTGTSDSNLAWVSKGEHVWTADEVARAGGHKAMFAMRKAVKSFAAGGVVGSLPGFDSSFIPNTNRHIDSLELAMNSKAQQWFGGRRSADIGALASSAGADTSGGSAAAKAYAMARLAMSGMANQFPALLRLWTMESSWNPNAVNPSSGAYGIPQALGHGHPYNLGDYQAQVDWGLNYIFGRYGSPGAALAHEFANNWYANGTRNAAKGWATVGEHGPELVRFRGGESVYSNRESRAMLGGGGPVTIVIQAWDGKSVDQWLNREGATKIQAALTRRQGRG